MYLSGVWSCADLWTAPSPTKDMSLKEIGHFTQIWVHVLGSTMNIMGWTYMIIQEYPPWHSIRKSYEVLQNWGNWLRPWFGIASHVLHQVHFKYPRRSGCKSNCFRPTYLTQKPRHEPRTKTHMYHNHTCWGLWVHKLYMWALCRHFSWLDSYTWVAYGTLVITNNRKTFFYVEIGLCAHNINHFKFMSIAQLRRPMWSLKEKEDLHFDPPLLLYPNSNLET
jgi:hypothetical protein